MTEAIAWALVALLVVAAFAWLLRPESDEPAAKLPGSSLPRCETCERWQGTSAAESAVCTWTRKVEERQDGCSRHVARRTP